MANVYEMITNKFIAMMEAGQIPWHKPWSGVAGVDGGAYNRVTKKAYSFLNQCLLSKPGEWASFKQWSNLGGKIKRGEKSEFVVFWKIMNGTREKVNNETGETETEKVSIPILRYLPVFHISQVEGVEPLEKSKLKETKPIEEAEEIRRAYVEREHITIKEQKGDKAYYKPLLDYIVVPEIGQFSLAEEFYSTLFHEMVHSTGNWKRLNRFEKDALLAPFGSEDYSKEELVAEMGSAFLLNHVGIDTEKTTRNNAAYIQSWLRVLKNDSRFVVSAASKAQKAAEYIINGKEEQQDERKSA